MSSLNWPRIILCGFVAGVTFALLSAVLVGTFGSAFLAAAGGGSIKTGPGLYFVTIAAGLWAMWLYVVVRPQFSSNVGAIITVSLAWWFIASLQSLKWVLLLDIPLAACLPLAGNLVPTVIAVFIGATLFGSVQSNQTLEPMR